MDVYQMLEAQSETIKKLRDANIKTFMEANAIMLRYQAAIDLGAAAIRLLEAKVKKLECEALGRAWNATNETQNGEGRGQ
jgi:hypothetical protein